MSRAVTLALALAFAAAAGCGACPDGLSCTFGGSNSGFPLVGAPPSLASLPHLNRGPATLTGIIYGADDTAWADFNEAFYSGATATFQRRFVHLFGAHEERVIPSTQKLLLTSGSIFLFDITNPDTPDAVTTVTLDRLGQSAPDAVFHFPGDKFGIVNDYFDERFLWFRLIATQTTFRIQRRTGGFRDVPLPRAADPTDPSAMASFRFTTSGRHVIAHSMDQLTVHASDVVSDLELKPHDGDYWIDDFGGQLIFCSTDGVLAVPLNGAPELVLDPVPCDTSGFITSWLDGTIYTSTAKNLRFVPTLDGKTAPVEFLPAGERWIGSGSTGQVIYSRDSSSHYANGSGDGWLGDWRFMDRGIDAGFSSDEKTVRWREHTALDSGVGELTAAAVPHGQPVRLAVNVRQFQELYRDGRILAIVNHAIKSTENRLVVIDEARRVQQWVAPAAHEYASIPGSTDVLVDVISGPSTYDIVRVPLPPKLP